MARRDHNPVDFKIAVPEDFYRFVNAAIIHARETRKIKISKRRVCLASGLSHATLFEAEKRQRDLAFGTIIRCCTVLGYELKLVRLPIPQSVTDYDEAIRERPGARRKKPLGGVNFVKRKVIAPTE